MPHRFALTLAAAAAAGGLLAATMLVSAAAATTATSPHIVAHPDSVMVNKTTKLTGTHFKANQTITIKECSQQTWIAPQNPCDTKNPITVTTNAKGQFKGTLTVHTCPGVTPVTPGFVETCYIGAPVGTGIDTLNLLGAVAITVTGP